MGAAEKHGAELCDTLFALQEGHLPPEFHQKARMLVNDIIAAGSGASLAELARLYRALTARLPGHTAQIRGCLRGHSVRRRQERRQ